MQRDFSERSRSELLGLVSEVENEKLCDFTDWVGDRWYDFESWIGQLNIKHYLDNVNEYHRKVIDKNNATEEQINQIFDAVRSVDSTYRGILSGEASSLENLQKYIVALSEIVSPSGAKFNAGDMSLTLDEIREDIEEDAINAKLDEWLESLLADENGLLDLFLLMAAGESGIGGASGSITLEALLEYLSSIGLGGEEGGSITLEALREYLTAKGLINEENGSLSVSSLTEYLSSMGLDEAEDINGLKTMFTTDEGILKAIGKYGKQEGASLASEVLGLLATLTGLTDSNVTTDDILSFFFSYVKSATGVETGLAKYYEKTLNPFVAMRLDQKYGTKMLGLSVLGSGTSFAEEGVDTYKIWTDPNSAGYEKVTQLIILSGSGFHFGGKAAVAVLGSQKYLRYVNSSGVVNQILYTPELKYTINEAAKNKISKYNTIIAIGDVAFSTASGSIKRIGQVTADGDFTIDDGASVGVYGSTSGLSAVVKGLTFGIVDIDAEKTAADLENDVHEFVKEDSALSEYIRNQDNPAVFRFGASLIGAAEIVGKKVVNGVVGLGKKIATGIATIENVGEKVISYASKTIVNNLYEEVSEIVSGNSAAVKYIQNENNSLASRLAVSAGVGATVVGTKIVNGVSETAKTVGSWISTGWNAMKSVFD